MTQPELSVVIPLYNKTREIERCLQSILRQTERNFEIVIVDDGSTDNSAEKVERIGDARIRLIRQVNTGVAAARNRAIAEARADFICFIDADDEWLPDHLEQMISLRRAVPQASLFLTAYWVDKGHNLRRRITVPRAFLRASGEIKNYFSIPDGKTLPAATGALKASLQAVGGYRQMFGEDMDLLLRVAARSTVAYGRKATAVWHLDADNRRCVAEEEAAALHQPGSLASSLCEIEESPAISSEVRNRARDYVARMESKAIRATVLSGNKAYARLLMDWWEREFGRKEQSMEYWINVSPTIILLYGRMRSYLGKASSAWGYLLDWLPSRRVFADHGRTRG